MMNFCNLCGGTLSTLVPEGDNRIRHVCGQCEHIHYQNPRVIVGCIPIWQNKILLCKRNIEPRLGYWTVPAGFLELEETMAEGAQRETYEESLARVNITYLHGLYDIPHIGQVYSLYMAEMENAEFGITPESSEVALFDAADIPWEDIAFKVVKLALEQYLQEGRRKDGQPFGL